MFYQGHIEPYRLTIQGERRGNNKVQTYKKFFFLHGGFSKRKNTNDQSFNIIVTDETTDNLKRKIDKLFQSSDYTSEIAEHIATVSISEEEMKSNVWELLRDYIERRDLLGKTISIKVYFLLKKEDDRKGRRVVFLRHLMDYMEEAYHELTDVPEDVHLQYSLGSLIIYQPLITVEGTSNPIEL